MDGWMMDRRCTTVIGVWIPDGGICFLVSSGGAAGGGLAAQCILTRGGWGNGAVRKRRSTYLGVAYAGGPH